MTNLVFAPPPLGTVLSLTGLPGGGNKAHDKSPCGNAATIVGATWRRLPSGLWCLSFDGTDDNVALGTPTSLDITGAITIMCWIKPDATQSSSWNYILHKFEASVSGYWLAEGYNGNHHVQIQVHHGGSPAYSRSYTSAALTPGVWAHVAGAAENGVDVKTFINGVEDSNENTLYADLVAPTGRTAQIGYRNSVQTYKGRMALLKVYNRALSALEIQDIFNREKHLFGVW